MLKRWLLVPGILLAFAAIAAGQATWRNSPADLEVMDGRLKSAAAKYADEGPYPYFALSDIGYPYDKAEFDKLDGNAVVLITALAQDMKYLPIKRVFVKADDGEFDLKTIRSFSSKIVDTKGEVAVLFGANRTDVLYLLPVYLRLKKAQLLIEFANLKTEVLNVFDGNTPAAIVDLPKTKPTGKGPSHGYLETFLQREYPAFFDSKSEK